MKLFFILILGIFGACATDGYYRDPQSAPTQVDLSPSMNFLNSMYKQPTLQKKKTTNCSPDGWGGFTCTEE